MTTSRIRKSLFSRLEGAEASKVFDEFKRSPGSLSDEMVAEIDHALMYQPHGDARRAGLVAFMKSGEELLELANTDRGGALTVAQIAVAAGSAADGHRAAADILDAARERALIALCERADMDSVIAEAEATRSDDGEVGHA